MTPAIRISLGIVSLTTTLLLAADWALDIFPDPHKPALEERQELSESFAIQFSAMVSADRLADMHLEMESMVALVQPLCTAIDPFGISPQSASL